MKTVGNTDPNKWLMKSYFDQIVKKEPKSVSEIIKEICSNEDLVITDIDTAIVLLKNKKQIFIYFYSTNKPEYRMIMTLVTHEDDNNNVIVESMKISDVNEKSYMVTF